MSELLPCPFCDREARVEQHEKGKWLAFCDDVYGCGTEGWYEDTPEEAIAAWNRRAPVIPPDVRERLAAYAHEAWSGWMRYMFGKTLHESITGGEIIPAWAVERWQRQMNTPYAELPESEKESDRDEADKMLAIVGSTAGMPPDVRETLQDALAYLVGKTMLYPHDTKLVNEVKAALSWLDAQGE